MLRICILKFISYIVIIINIISPIRSSYCGQAAIPFTFQVLKSGQLALGCARPSCFGWNANGEIAGDSARFYRIHKKNDGYLRDGDSEKKNFLKYDYYKSQTSICQPGYNSTSCDLPNQWVGGIAPSLNASVSPLLMKCCVYDGLTLAIDRGNAEVTAGQIVVGGEVLKQKRQYAFDYISNIQKILKPNGLVNYNVTVKRFPCLSPLIEPNIQVDDQFMLFIRKVDVWLKNKKNKQKKMAKPKKTLKKKQKSPVTQNQIEPPKIQDQSDSDPVQQKQSLPVKLQKQSQLVKLLKKSRQPKPHTIPNPEQVNNKTVLAKMDEYVSKESSTDKDVDEDTEDAKILKLLEDERNGQVEFNENSSVENEAIVSDERPSPLMSNAPNVPSLPTHLEPSLGFEHPFLSPELLPAVLPLNMRNEYASNIQLQQQPNLTTEGRSNFEVDKKTKSDKQESLLNKFHERKGNFSRYHVNTKARSRMQSNFPVILPYQQPRPVQGPHIPSPPENSVRKAQSPIPTLTGIPPPDLLSPPRISQQAALNFNLPQIILKPPISVYEPSYQQLLPQQLTQSQHTETQPEQTVLQSQQLQQSGLQSQQNEIQANQQWNTELRPQLWKTRFQPPDQQTSLQLQQLWPTNLHLQRSQPSEYQQSQYGDPSLQAPSLEPATSSPSLLTLPTLPPLPGLFSIQLSQQPLFSLLNLR